MSSFLRVGSRPHRVLDYMVYHPKGLNAMIAYRELGDLNLHSTISTLRNFHCAKFIRAYPIHGLPGRPKQYFISPLDLLLAKRMLGESRRVKKSLIVKGGVSSGKVKREA